MLEKKQYERQIASSLFKPKKFLWGVATASYQVEGDITNNDWEFFTRSAPIRNRISRMSTPSLINNDLRVQLQPARDAVKFWDPMYYNRYFDIAKSLGMNSFRISIEWARVEPQRNVWDDSAINHYQQMISDMRQRGLTPVVTLNHFTLPSWVLTPPAYFQSLIQLPHPYRDIPLANPQQSDPYWQSLLGWENEQTVNEFIEYVSKIVIAVKDQVDYWLTINEPVTSTIGLGYILGVWSPGFILDSNRAKKVLHNLIEAHVRAYNTISAMDNVDSDGDGIPAKIGFAHSMMSAAPISSEPASLQVAKNFDYFANDYFLNAVVNGKEDLNYLDTLEKHNQNSPNFIMHNDWQNKVDFIGLNYYRRVRVQSNIILDSIMDSFNVKFIGGVFGSTQPNSLVNDLGWEIYPQGLHDILVKIKNQWNKPVLITENGIPDRDDKYRAQFIVAHLQQLKRAIDEGVEVLGYIYWSLMDNFEWSYNYRNEAKFGLYSIDRSGREHISDTKVHLGLVGGNGNDTINVGVMLPSSNCVIDDVILELVDKEGNISSATSRGQPDAVNDPIYNIPITSGARIVSSNEGTTNLAVQVHWFFTAGNAVRYRLHYFFKGNDCDNDGQPDFNGKETKGAQALQTIITESEGAAAPITDSSLTNAANIFGTFSSNGRSIILPKGTKDSKEIEKNYICKEGR